MLVLLHQEYPKRPYSGPSRHSPRQCHGHGCRGDDSIVSELLIASRSDRPETQVIGVESNAGLVPTTLRCFKPDPATPNLALPDGTGLEILDEITPAGLDPPAVRLPAAGADDLFRDNRHLARMFRTDRELAAV